MNNQTIKSEDAAPYAPQIGKAVPDSEMEDEIIQQAKDILARRMMTRGVSLTDPQEAVDYLHLKLQAQEREVFACLFLDTRHRVIEYQEMFFGTINGASVHPREVVKEALRLNAAAIIFAHNHPSGIAEPSSADRHLTNQLRDTLKLVEVKALDHFVIGAGEHVSFAERGWL